MKDLLPWRKKEDSLLPSLRRHDMDLLHRRMNDLFDDFFEGFEEMYTGGRLPLMRSEAKWLAESPSFEVSETDEEFRVKAELPGMDEKDIDISLEGNALTIRGEKKRELEEKRRDYHVSEMSFGEFSRTFTLPDGVDRDKAKAQFKKGVLTLSLPKTEQMKAQRKRIDISTS